MTAFRMPVVGLCALLLTISSLSFAESDVNEGRKRFNRGVELFREGDFSAAMIEFRRAYEVAPNYRVLFNIGQTASELRDYASALDAFERYLAEGGKDVPAARRKMVGEEIEKLKSRVAQLQIKTSIDGAEVFIDDVSVGQSPISKPIRVSAGQRKISASHQGARAEKRLEIAGGDNLTVELDLAETRSETAPEPKREPVVAPAPVVTREPTHDTKSREGGLPTGVWVGVAVTGALTAGAIVSGVFALRAKNDYDQKADTFGSDAKDLEDRRDRTRQLALLTDVLGGAAIVSGGVTLYFALSSSGASAKSTSKAPRVGVGPRGVTLDGRF